MAAFSSSSQSLSLPVGVGDALPFNGFKTAGYNTYYSWYSTESTARYGLDYTISPVSSSNGVLANDPNQAAFTLTILKNGNIAPSKSFHLFWTIKTIADSSGLVEPGTEIDFITDYTFTIPEQKGQPSVEVNGEEASLYASPDVLAGLKEATKESLLLTGKAGYNLAASVGESVGSASPHYSVDAFYADTPKKVELFSSKLETSANKAAYVGVALKVGTAIGSAINEFVDTGGLGGQSQKAFKDLSTAMLSGVVGEVVGGGTAAFVAGIVGTAATTTVAGAFLPVLAGVAVGALVAGALEPTIGAVVEAGSTRLSDLVGGALHLNATAPPPAASSIAPDVTSRADITATATAASVASSGATHDGMTVGSAAPKPAWIYNSDTKSFQWISPPSTETLQKLVSYVDQSVSKLAIDDYGSVAAAGTIAKTGGETGTGALAGDHDPAGYALSIVDLASGTVGQPSTGKYGHLTLNADGSYKYVADNALGVAGDVHDVFLYKVSNGHGSTAISMLDITVHGSQSSADLTPVFRFYDTNTYDHFYTTNVIEKNSIMANMPNFQYEGAQWSTPQKGADTVDVFRFYDTVHGTHFLTTSVGERDSIIANQHTYNYEGVAFEAYKDGAALGVGGLTLERFYNTVTGNHHYSASAIETYGINHGSAGANWVDEGPGFTVHVATAGMLNA
ncbi:Ig-like domain-containing protein [Methylobacterium sp. M6A4_1b]